jgi:hypothetical protein
MAKSIVMVVGVVFVLIGVLGFFNNPILGIFEVDTVHNLVHLVSGAVALFMASAGEMGAKKFAKVFGLVYLLVAVLGFVMADDGMLLGLMAINGADNYLHVALALVFLWVGFGKSSPAPSMGSMGGQM